MATPASFVPASELLAAEAACASVLPRGCTFTETDWRAQSPTAKAVMVEVLPRISGGALMALTNFI
jgi:hypothetical protein